MNESYKFLFNLPKPGDKIVFNKLSSWHWFTNILESEKKLVIGQEYTVDKTELASSATYVWTKEFPEEMLSMHAFTWTVPEIKAEQFIGMPVMQARMIQLPYAVKIGDWVSNETAETIFDIEYDKTTLIITGAKIRE